MAWTPNSANAELQAGINHVTVGRENTQSVTLDGALQHGGPAQQATDPHAVLNTAMGGGSDDSAYERFQRTQGGYAPGSMTSMQDEITQGSDEED